MASKLLLGTAVGSMWFVGVLRWVVAKLDEDIDNYFPVGDRFDSLC